ncbi:MAG TPA: hypothetical protein DHV93_11240 [Holophagaceae bacterium]|nr:hypothetical protein [Holophagaceae bacterium]
METGRGTGASRRTVAGSISAGAGGAAAMARARGMSSSWRRMSVSMSTARRGSATAKSRMRPSAITAPILSVPAFRNVTSFIGCSSLKGECTQQ